MHIRTRFAPSPTGALHSGTIRTTVFAWLLAKHTGGQFLLRIEDTDQKREVPGAVENIMESIQWLGIEWDEGPDIGGPYSPYTQSQRLEVYKQWATKLYEEGKAYADPYSAEELQAFREAAQKAKKPFLYRDHRPENPPAWDGSQPLRIKLDPKSWSWNDAIMGEITMGPEMIDDFILMKSDGFPTYNFAHIIDDHLMKITHVLRSQEFLSSIPKYLAVHEALELPMPINATVPPVQDETGRAKLSKRKGAKPVLEYRDLGYLPEAMLNFLASMGWNDGTEQEIFTRDELIEKFSLERVQKSGAIFDEKRLLWMNGMHIRQLSIDDLTARVEAFWPASAKDADGTYKKQVLELAQDRLKTLTDLPNLTSYFFEEPTPDWSMIEDNKQLKKLEKEEIATLLQAAHDSLETSAFDTATLQHTLNSLLDKTGQKPGVLFSLIRIAITWAPFSPALNDTMAVLGKDTVIARLKTAISLSVD
jgi:glutamyl-tRNA synthetase